MGLPDRVRFLILGPLEVTRSGQPVTITSGRQRAVLAALLVAKGDAVTSDRLIESVWGDDLPANPANTLQHAIAQLRKALEPDRGRGDEPTVLLSQGGGYRIDWNDQEVDAAIFEDGMTSGARLLGEGQPAEAEQTVIEALGLWRGQALADFAVDDFADAERDRLDELRVAARELLVDVRLESSTNNATVISDLESLVIEFPYREGLWARLMTVLYREGRQAEALRVYRRAADTLGEDLGLEPSHELRELEQRILVQDASLTATPSTRSPKPVPTATPTQVPTPTPTPAHNLPASTTSFIGRERDLAELLDQLESSRLVTLLGPGGSGKTRLALEAARQALPRFADGVRLARLDDLRQTSLLVPSIGAVLGMPETPERTVEDTLCAFIGDKHLLLVVDNCEQVIAGVARLAELLLARCPNLVLLATSQEALRLTGEQRHPVGPLALPGQQSSPFARLDSSPAVELFLDRAGSIDPDFDPSTDAMNAIANIVVALDGLPLAIELAAARIDSMSAVEIARRLADRFSVLTDGPRDAPERQRALRHTVEWSVGLLTEAERRFLADLSIFVGGCDVQAVASVAGHDEHAAMSLIQALRRRSLLTHETDSRGRSRYRLLESLRQYGLELLGTEGDHDVVARRHTDFFADRAFDLDLQLMGPDQTDAFASFVVDEDNFRAAMARGLDEETFAAPLAVAGLRIAARMGRFWDWRGTLAEALTWLSGFDERVIAQSLPHSTPDLGFMISWRSYFTSEVGDIEQSRAMTARARHIAEEQGDRYSLAVILSGVALLARVGGDGPAALDADDQLRAIGIELSDQWLIAWADDHDTLVLLDLGRHDEAAAAAERSRAGFESVGDRRACGWAVTGAAQVAHARGDHPKAIELARSAAKRSIEAGDGRNAAWAYEIAAESARAAGDDQSAESLAGEAASLLAERGMSFSPWRRPQT